MWEVYSDVRGLLEVGGNVLRVIFAVAVVMWMLIFERFWYLTQIHPDKAESIARQWDAMEDKSTWDAQVIRRMWMSELLMDLNQWLAAIRALVTVCPLLGLLGTTSGMIEVYEVMALKGSGEPRMMAEGVSQAMVTTMAGLVVALSGIFFSARLENRRLAETELLAFRLHIDEDLLGGHHRVRSERAKKRAAEENLRRMKKRYAAREAAEEEEEREARTSEAS